MTIIFSVKCYSTFSTQLLQLPTLAPSNHWGLDCCRSLPLLFLHLQCVDMPTHPGQLMVGRAHHGEILSKLAQIVDEGKLRPLLDAKTFSITEAGFAHQYAESDQAIGKVVLTQSFSL